MKRFYFLSAPLEREKQRTKNHTDAVTTIMLATKTTKLKGIPPGSIALYSCVESVRNIILIDCTK